MVEKTPAHAGFSRSTAKKKHLKKFADFSFLGETKDASTPNWTNSKQQ